MLTRTLPFILSSLLSAGAAHAQSSLGIQGVSVEFGYGMTDDNRTTLSGLTQLDVMVTDVHGLQLDFGLKDDDRATLGQLGAHIYMHPVGNQKYGFFAVLSDVDEDAIQYMNAGIEGRIGLSDTTAVEFRFGVGGTTGMGGTTTANWDYVFVGGGYMQKLTPETTFEARIDVTEFDERGFTAVGVDSQLRLSHSTRGSNFGAYAEVRNNALMGRDSATPITTVGVGVTITIGAPSDQMMARPFQIATPLDQLVTRGIVASF